MAEIALDYLYSERKVTSMDGFMRVLPFANQVLLTRDPQKPVSNWTARHFEIAKKLLEQMASGPHSNFAHFAKFKGQLLVACSLAEREPLPDSFIQTVSQV